MDMCLLIRRVCALTLVVALSIIGRPLPASAAGDEDPAPARPLDDSGAAFGARGGYYAWDPVNDSRLLSRLRLGYSYAAD